jgi:peptidoglycan/LPS O-acetylase OafA/YrhL
LAKRFDPRLAIGAGIVAFVVVVLFAPYLTPGGHKDNVFGATWIGLAMALATFGVANGGKEPRQSGPLMRGLAWCGARCYSLYLLHVPVLGLIFLAVGRVGKPMVDDLSTLGLAVLATGLTLVIADFCYRRVELPFMELAGRLAPNPGHAAGAIPVSPAE